MEDIIKYVRDEEGGDYKTNKQYIGMKELFHGYIVRDWKGVDLNTNK